MIGIPTFLANDAIVIKKTPNGYAVCESMSAPVESCPVFETWGALAYYVETNYVNAAAA